jgi:hypothetical protein
MWGVVLTKYLEKTANHERISVYRVTLKTEEATSKLQCEMNLPPSLMNVWFPLEQPFPLDCRTS